MSELERIQNQMQRAFSGPAWHGDSLCEILKGVDAVQAAAKPQGAAHSIWELVLHVTAWIEVVRRRLSDRYDIPPNTEQDWPPVGTASPERWAAALERLQQAHSDLVQALSAFPEQRLDSNVPGGDANQEISYYVLLHGSVHHVLYHAGQMAVVKRLVREKS